MNVYKLAVTLTDHMQNLHEDKPVILKDIEPRKRKLTDLEEHEQQVTFFLLIMIGITEDSSKVRGKDLIFCIRVSLEIGTLITLSVMPAILETDNFINFMKLILGAIMTFSTSVRLRNSGLSKIFSEFSEAIFGILFFDMYSKQLWQIQ